MYKGVSWHKHSQKWYAYIQHSGKMHGLGYFHDEHKAAEAYDKEARKVGPPFCRSYDRTYLHSIVHFL